MDYTVTFDSDGNRHVRHPRPLHLPADIAGNGPLAPRVATPRPLSAALARFKDPTSDNERALVLGSMVDAAFANNGYHKPIRRFRSHIIDLMDKAINHGWEALPTGSDEATQASRVAEIIGGAADRTQLASLLDTVGAIPVALTTVKPMAAPIAASAPVIAPATVIAPPVVTPTRTYVPAPSITPVAASPPVAVKPAPKVASSAELSPLNLASIRVLRRRAR